MIISTPGIPSGKNIFNYKYLLHEKYFCKAYMKMCLEPIYMVLIDKDHTFQLMH